MRKTGIYNLYDVMVKKGPPFVNGICEVYQLMGGIFYCRDPPEQGFVLSNSILYNQAIVIITNWERFQEREDTTCSHLLKRYSRYSD